MIVFLIGVATGAFCVGVGVLVAKKIEDSKWD